jgi:hypothetical protein
MRDFNSMNSAADAASDMRGFSSVAGDHAFRFGDVGMWWQQRVLPSVSGGRAGRISFGEITNMHDYIAAPQTTPDCGRSLDCGSALLGSSVSPVLRYLRQGVLFGARRATGGSTIAAGYFVSTHTFFAHDGDQELSGPTEKQNSTVGLPARWASRSCASEKL